MSGVNANSPITFLQIVYFAKCGQLLLPEIGHFGDPFFGFLDQEFQVQPLLLLPFDLLQIGANSGTKWNIGEVQDFLQVSGGESLEGVAVELEHYHRLHFDPFQVHLSVR